MSLVITSSRQQEFDGTPEALKGIENPASYKNHMKSPLIVPPNSEIAVVSVKMDRKNVIVVDRGDRMALYWGLQPNAADADTWMNDKQPHLPIYLQVDDGTYTQNEFAAELETALTAITQKTYSNISDVTVKLIVEANEQFATYEITFNALDDNTAIDLTALTSADWLSCINSANDTPSEIEIRRAYGAGPYDKTDDFTPTAGTGKLVMGSAGTPGKACAILKNNVLSSTDGVCEFSFEGYNGNLKVGLVRNIPSNRAAPARFNSEFQSPNFAGSEGNKISQFFDYGFSLERSGAGPPTSWGLTHSVTINPEGVDDPNGFVGTQMVRVPNASLVTSPVNGSFDSTKGVYFNKVRFTRIGEGIRVDLVDNKTNVSNIVSETASKAFKPCGDASDLLYAKIFMDGTAGEIVELTKFEVCNTAPSKNQAYDVSGRNYGYELAPNNSAEYVSIYQQYQDEYTMGNQGFGNIQTSVGYADANLQKEPIYNLLNADGSQKREWGLVLGPDPLLSAVGDGYEIPPIEQMVPTDNMRKRLGFAETVVLEDDDAYAGENTETVIFRSNQEQTLSHNKNMFIRWHPTQQVSYNSNQGSISKIIYACPRFDVQKYYYGSLYFEPNERVYCDCNNVDSLMITDIQVDIVDINEMLVTDLIGTTQINFHIRQKEGFTVGRNSGRT